MTAAPDRRRPGQTSPLAQPALVPGGGQLNVGNETRGSSAARSQRPVAVRQSPAARVPFGSYLPADLHKAFKVACITEEIEMQDALAEAVTDWLAKRARKSH